MRRPVELHIRTVVVDGGADRAVLEPQLRAALEARLAALDLTPRQAAELAGQAAARVSARVPTTKTGGEV